MVGQCSVQTLGAIFAPTSRQASSNYGIGYDGKIGMYCEEKDRSWCSSSGANDHRAITIEVASDTYSPYRVNAKAYAALIDLCTDICKRNNIKELRWKADKSLIGQVDKQNMTVHRWFANKSCPGDYLYNLHTQIAKEINARLGVTVEVNPDPVIGETALSFKAGDVVKITGTKYYGGKSVPSWVRNKNWVVYSAAGDRVVVNKSEDGKNAIMSPFKASDLALAKQTVVSVTGTPSTGNAVDEKKIWDFFYGKLGNYFGVAGLMGNLYTADSVERHEDEVAYIKNAASRVKILMGKASDKKANKEIEKAYDILHSSPSRSVATVKLLEEEIKNKVTDLEDAVAADETAVIITIAGEIVAKTEERNRKLKMAN